MIDYGNFGRSLKNLELQNANRKQLPLDLPQLIHEGIDESVSRRFETCNDTLWKTLRRYLIEEMGFVTISASPRTIIRTAGESELLHSPVERWMEYINLRIGTAHDYSGEKATAALGRVDDFIADAIGLYQVMVGESWE
jgi:hypothetical protein